MLHIEGSNEVLVLGLHADTEDLRLLLGIL